jgi:hypothetical protein
MGDLMFAGLFILILCIGIPLGRVMAKLDGKDGRGPG